MTHKLMKLKYTVWVMTFLFFVVVRLQGKSTTHQNVTSVIRHQPEHLTITVIYCDNHCRKRNSGVL